MSWRAEAPSNIAFIKYMGKVEGANPNTPANVSLSYALPNFLTAVEIAISDGAEDTWEPLICKEYPYYPQAGHVGERFLKHWAFLKNEWKITGTYILKSANNFASDCGMASSASSFAALTMATYQVALEKGQAPELSVYELAAFSRQGSGSSCRSFFAPWSVWDEEGAREMELGTSDLLHEALVLDDRPKEVSSSEAHRRVTTSSLYMGRNERADRRCQELVESLENGDWERTFNICWDEFWDMHSLFETSEPSFSYMTEKTRALLEDIRGYWETHKDGPVVTMDAGPNIHLFFRPDQKHLLGQWRAQ